MPRCRDSRDRVIWVIHIYFRINYAMNKFRQNIYLKVVVDFRQDYSEYRLYDVFCDFHLRESYYTGNLQ